VFGSPCCAIGIVGRGTCTNTGNSTIALWTVMDGDTIGLACVLAYWSLVAVGTWCIPAIKSNSSS